MEYPVIANAIQSHQKSYNDMTLKSTFGGIGFNLMYEPCHEYSFDMAEKTTIEKYYGRFLNAVGMEFLLKRKRRLSPEPAESSAKKSKKPSENIESKKDECKAPNQVNVLCECKFRCDIY